MPGKTMKKIMDKPLLYYSVKRSSFAKYVDKVIVATTTNSKDDEIAEWCESEKIPYFRGSEEDVLDRYYKTAKKFNIDTVVRVTSDCPFVDPSIIDTSILLRDIYDKDYVSNRIKKMSTLEKTWKEAKDQREREHVDPYILSHLEIFSMYEFPYEKDLSYIRLTVDYPEDFELTKQLLEILVPKYGIKFNWKDVIFEIDKNPRLLKINNMRVDTKI